MKSKKTKIDVRDKAVTTLSSTIWPYKGQYVTIHLESTGGLVPKTYQWQKNNVNIEGQTKPTLTIPAPDADETYKCIVHDGEAQYTSNDCIVKSAIDVPAKCEKLFDVTFNEYHRNGFVKLHWDFVTQMDHVVELIATGKELSDSLKESIERGPNSILYTMHCALMKCGKVVVQDSRDGYFTMYDIGQDEGVSYKHGSITNFWHARR